MDELEKIIQDYCGYGDHGCKDLAQKIKDAGYIKSHGIDDEVFDKYVRKFGYIKLPPVNKFCYAPMGKIPCKGYYGGLGGMCNHCGEPEKNHTPMLEHPEYPTVKASEYCSCEKPTSTSYTAVHCVYCRLPIRPTPKRKRIERLGETTHKCILEEDYKGALSLMKFKQDEIIDRLNKEAE